MNILLVKLSSLGDVVHALPVLQDIHAALPAAQIDWVVEKSFASLLARSPGVQRIIPCEIRRWRKSPLAAVTRSEWRAFKAQLQQESYDAVIDLQGLSKSALVARLARLAPGGKRYALANQTEGSGYEAPTRWVADVAIPVEPRIDAVRRSRELAARALGYAFAGAPDFGLKVPLAQEERAQEAPENIAKTVAFVHGTSRADKEWPLAHWVELGQRLMAAGYRIALPHGSARELATSQAIAQALPVGACHEPAAGPPQGGLPPLGGQRSTRSDKRGGCAVIWPQLSLAALTDELAHCAGVIGVDSGVSHIAVALDLPHVQIYNFDTAWRTGPGAGLPPGTVTRQLSVFAQPTPGVETVWQAWLACLGTVKAA